MNNKLKKDTKTAAKAYQRKYMKNHRMLCCCLDKEKDEDIIEWMNEQPSITESVKRILRWEINGRDDYDYMERSPEGKTPAGNQATEGSKTKYGVKAPKDRLPEKDPEDGKRAEDLRSPAKGLRTCKTCQESLMDCYHQTCYCNNEESEKAGQNTEPSDTCSAWR